MRLLGGYVKLRKLARLEWSELDVISGSHPGADRGLDLFASLAKNVSVLLSKGLIGDTRVTNCIMVSLSAEP